MALFLAVFLKLFRLFQCFWNEFLDKMKFTSVKLCKAKNVDPSSRRYIPCTKYTYRKYCPSHKLQLAKACEQYHYIRGLASDHPKLHVYAQKELDARNEFCQRFSISSDYGHIRWCEHLKGIIKRDEQLTFLHEQFERERNKNVSIVC